MDREFIFENTQTALDYNNFCIKSIFVDLFEGSLGNEPIVTRKASEKFDVIEQITAFLPTSVIDAFDEKIKESKNTEKIHVGGQANGKEYIRGMVLFYKYIVARNGKTHTPITIIKKAYKNNLCQLITEVENALDTNIFDSENVIVNDYALKLFFTELKDKISRKNSISYKMYQIFLDNKSYKKILARLFVTMIFLMNTEAFSWNYKIPEEENRQDSGTLDEIWTFDDTSKDGVIKYHIKHLYSAKQYLEAYNLLMELKDKESPLLFKDEELQYIYAKILLEGKHRKNGNCDVINAKKFLIEHCNDNPNAQYLLYQIYKGIYNTLIYDGKKAQDYFERAVELGSSYAILKMCMEMQTNNIPDYNKIAYYLNLISEKIEDEIQKGVYHYLRGLVFLNNGQVNEADREFDIAINLGFTQAHNKKSRKYRKTNEFYKEFAKNSGQILVVNSLNNNTLTLLRDLSADYSVFSIKELSTNNIINNIQESINVSECFKKLNPSTFLTKESIVFALLGDDDNENLVDCLEILDRLYNCAIDIKSSKLQKKFIQSIDIYIKTNYDYASLFLDASLSDMGDIFFKVHLIDINRVVAHNLIWEQPMFKGFLGKGNKIKESNIVIFGSSDFTRELHKEIIAATYIGNDRKISVYHYCSLNSKDKLEKQMELLMPGLYNNRKKSDKNIEFLKPNIKEIDLNSNYIFKNIVEENNEENNIIINKAKYFVIDIGTDSENIQFAINLRRSFAKLMMSEEEMPFIAVSCKDSKTAYLAKRMTILNATQTDVWYNNYDLYFFGMADTVFSYNALFNNELERIAEQIHFSYSGGNSYQSQNQYYSFQYNQDSSLLAGIAIRYRLFCLGCYEHKNKRSSYSLYEDKGLLKESQLSVETDIENYGRIEQTRWCNYMLTRSWERPTSNQLDWYLNSDNLPGNTGHKYLLSLLHPYLTEWDNLDDDDTLKIIREFYDKQGKVPTPPKEITKQGIIDVLKSISKIQVSKSQSKIKEEVKSTIAEYER